MKIEIKHLEQYSLDEVIFYPEGFFFEYFSYDKWLALLYKSILSVKKSIKELYWKELSDIIQYDKPIALAWFTCHKEVTNYLVKILKKAEYEFVWNIRVSDFKKLLEDESNEIIFRKLLNDYLYKNAPKEFAKKTKENLDEIEQKIEQKEKEKNKQVEFVFEDNISSDKVIELIDIVTKVILKYDMLNKGPADCDSKFIFNDNNGMIYHCVLNKEKKTIDIQKFHKYIEKNKVNSDYFRSLFTDWYSTFEINN